MAFQTYFRTALVIPFFSSCVAYGLTHFLSTEGYLHATLMAVALSAIPYSIFALYLFDWSSGKTEAEILNSVAYLPLIFGSVVAFLTLPFAGLFFSVFIVAGLGFIALGYGYIVLGWLGWKLLNRNRS